MKKSKTKVVLMVVLAMLLQIIGPAVQSVYAEIANGPFSMTERPIGEDGIVQLDWEFTLDTNDRVEEYTYTGNFTLENEVPEADLVADDEITVIGSYSISTDGEITVKINQELYENLEDNEEEQGIEATDTLPEEENNEVQEGVVEEGEGAETEEPEEGQHLQEGENSEGNEGKSDDLEEGNGDEVTGEGLEESTDTEGNDENNEQSDPENDDEVNEEEQEVSMLGKVSATLDSVGDDLLLTDDIDQEEVIEETKGVKFFTGTIEVERAKEKESLFRRFAGLFSGPKNLGDIFSNIVLSIDDVPITGSGDTPIEIDDGTEVELTYDWAIEDGTTVNDGDYAEIKIPRQFELDGLTGGLIATIVNGEGETIENEVVATYTVVGDSLRVVFNGILGDLANRQGQGEFALKFDLEEFKDNILQEIVFEEPINKTFNIKAKPTGGDLKLISKSGLPNAEVNADAINWQIDVNTSLESLQNALVEDTIPDGLELDGEIEIYHLMVGLDGITLTEGSKVADDIVKATTVDKTFTIPFGKINSAYRIKYNTKITDFEQASYTNKAVLIDGETEKEASVTIYKIQQGSDIEKRAIEPDKNANKITWEIDVNKGEKDLKSIIVYDELLTEGLTIDNSSIKVYKLTKSGTDWIQGTTEVTEIDTSTGFPLDLGNLNKEAYRIVFDTDIEYMAYNESNSFQNKAILKTVVGGEEGKQEEVLGESTATANVSRDPVILKEGKEITSYNSEYPIVEWIITINKANHHIYDAVLTDIIGSGLELIDGTIEVFDSNGNPVTPKNHEEGYPTILDKQLRKMEIAFGEINSSYTVKYQTKITSTDESTFRNQASLRGKGRHGIGVGPGQDYIEYDVGKTVNEHPSHRVTNTYEKTAFGIDYSDKTITWKIVVDARKEAIESLNISDTFEPLRSMVFLEDGFVVKKGSTILIRDTDYTLVPSGKDGFTLTFAMGVGKLGKGYYEITYKTSFDPNMVLNEGGTINLTSNYKNKAALTVTVKDAVGEGSTTSTIERDATQTINTDIYNVGKKEGTLNRSAREITWRIYVNAQSQNLIGQDLVITDTIGPNQTFVQGSLSVRKFTLKPDGYLGLDDINIGSTVTGYSSNTSANPFTLTFTNGINEAYLVEYRTKINGISDETYTNTAVISGKEGIRAYTDSVSYEKHDEFISKEALLGSSSGKVYKDDEINWEVKLNESLSEISNAVFQDTISAGHIYVNGSLKVYKGTVAEENLVTIAADKFTVVPKDSGQEITLSLGYIDDIYIITYDTAVTADVGANISNEASFTGSEITGETSSEKTFNVSKSSWGTGTGVSATKGAIKITKVDKADSNKKLQGAGFKLYYMLNGEKIEVKSDTSSGLFYTDAKGELVIGNLPRGRTYILEEVEPPLGYKFPQNEADRTRTIQVVANTITEGDNIVNERIRDITIKKVWIGPGKTGNGAGSSTFKLKANGADTGKSLTLTTTTGWTDKFERLDYYDSSNNEIEYTVEEVNLDSRYQLLGEPVKVVDVNLGNVTYTFNNKNMETINVAVEKKWKKEDSKAIPESIVIELYQNGVKTSSFLILNKSNSWKDTFTDLIKYDDEGREIGYTIKEEPVTGFKPVITGNRTDGYTVTNIQTMDIPVTKKWIGTPKTTSVQVALHEKNESGALINPAITTLTIDGNTTDKQWSGIFKDIPKYKSNGDLIQYGTKEKTVSGFRTEISGNQTDGFTVTNVELVNVKVTKKWIGGATAGITVNLLADGIAAGKSVTLTTENNKAYTFTNLDKYEVDEHGNETEIEYTVEEVLTGLEEKYTKQISDKIISGSDINYTITNNNIEKISITVEKVWRIENAEDTPTSVEIVLKNNQNSETKRITLKVANSWKHTFVDLFKYDQDNGNLITYSIEEVSVDGFKTVIQGNQAEGFTVTNIELMDIDVEKVWIGSYDGISEVEVTLYEVENLAKVGDIKLNSPTWTGKFENIPKYKVNSNIPITYTIKETPISGYEVEITGNENEGFTVTNRELVNITGTKIWINGPSNKPTIELQLYRDEEAHGSPVTLTDGSISYTWNNLYKTDKDGKSYDYTVDEVNVPDNYTKTISEDGLIITNTYTPEKTDITGTKIWINSPETKPTIWFKLYRQIENGSILEVGEAEIKEMSNGAANVTWIDMDKTDTNGNEYTYSVKEVNENGDDFTPEHYTKQENGLSVTNTYIYVSPKIEVIGIKNWVDGPNIKPTISLQLYRNNEPLGETIELVNGTTTYTWTDLDKTDKNRVDYQYRIDEVEEPENYGKSISDDGLTITNTYGSPKTAITGSKIWLDGPSNRPTIELQLFRDGIAYGDPVELANGKLSHTWNGLDKTDNMGNPYNYTVDEVEVPENYTKSISEDKLTVTNTYVIPKTDITVNKVWKHGPAIKPNIELQLFRRVNGGVKENVGTPITLEYGKTEYTWENLDQTNESGAPYIYTVDEVEVPENYVKSIDGLTITNTYDSPKTNIEAMKIWINGEQNRPDSIELQLYRKAGGDGLEEAVGEPVKLEKGIDKYVWEDQPINDEDGNPYIYTVDEVEVPENYTKSISKDGLTITNTYVIPKADIIGTKKWVGGSSNKPSVELQLYRNGVKYEDPVKLDGKETTPWTYTWEDLDKTDIDGKEYKYTVDEVRVPNEYIKSISSDGLTVTNTYDPEDSYYPPTGPGPGPGPTTPPKPTEPEKPTEEPKEEEENPETPEEPTEPGTPVDPEEPTNPPTDVEETTPKDTPKEGEIEVPENSPEPPRVNNPPENGTVTIDENGKWVYTPNPGFEGKDKFSIIITKPDGTEEEIFFEIDVQTPLGVAEVEENEEKETPILPKTGQVDSILIYLAGLFFIVLGMVLRKRIA